MKCCLTNPDVKDDVLIADYDDMLNMDVMILEYVRRREKTVW
jgi:hypothetical protein